VTNGPGLVFQNVAGLIPGELYRITVFAQAAPGTTGFGSLYVHDTTGVNAVADGPRNISPGAWQEYAVNFVATSTEAMRIDLISNSSVTLYWDDVHIFRGWGEGFEQADQTAWTVFGGAAWNRTGAALNSGLFSALTTGSSGIFQNIGPITPGQFYHVTACGHSELGSNGMAVLYVHDTTGANTVFDGPRSPSFIDWDRYAVNFPATSTSEVRINLIQNVPNQALYWDDIQITPGWVEDFETDALMPWSSFGPIADVLSSVVANSGVNSLAESNCLTSGGVYQDISGLLAGQMYQVTARVFASTNATASAFLFVHDTTGADAVEESGPPVPGYWNAFAVNFVATSTGKLRLHLGCQSGSGTIYWDDVLIINTNL
jgi:hypothetical protein